MKTSRRDFLRLGTVVVAASAIPSLVACKSSSDPSVSDAAFPQGLGSGDPKPTRVMLWSRVEPAGVGQTALGTIAVTFLVAIDEALTHVVAQGTVSATPEADHTVRVGVDGLAPGTQYFYRFGVGDRTTRVGRTKTAPTAESDAPVTFAFASCQDFIGRYYHAWQALLDERADLDFVLFLGDYIYETTGDPSFQTPTADRSVALPDGLDISEAQDRSVLAAFTLADYRALYKAYRSDASLKEVHRLYPFVSIWDDHEFSDDAWQDHSTYFNERDPKTGAATDEKNTPRRVAASQAWYEYTPIDTGFDGTKDFSDQIRIWRNLRFGKHVDLFLTDERLYRADHLIPEGPLDMNVGKISLNASAGSRYLVVKSTFDDRELAAKPSMLGATQKEWFLGAVKASNATWKVWGNEVQLWQMVLDLSPFAQLPASLRRRFYYDVDQWDGFRSERAAILGALAGSSNLVACTGDIHAFFAAELYVDFDTPATRAGVEFVTAGISSLSAYKIVQKTVNDNLVLRGAGLDTVVPQFDTALFGSNPHLKHAQSDANGLAIARVSASAFEVTFLGVSDVTNLAYGGVLKRTTLRTMSGSNLIA